MPTKKQKKSQELPEFSRRATLESRVLKIAIKMAVKTKWYDLSLSDVAVRSGFTLNEVRSSFADTDAIANAWFDNALDTMLSQPPKGFELLPVRERMEMLLLQWFDTLTPHREASISMLRSKLHLPHFQNWGPLIFSLSRHVQLWRDASGLRATGLQRRIEEIALTAVFLATLAVWCRDTSVGQEQTRKFLHRRLKQGDMFMTCYFTRYSQGLSKE